MKAKRIIDISVIGREIELKSTELFGIYRLIINLKNINQRYNMSKYDQDRVSDTINLLSNIIDKNSIENLLYGECSDIFEFTEISPIDPATILDNQLNNE